MRLAQLAADCGLDGIVASAQEASLIRNSVQPADFVIVTPGIRATNATSDDQKRVTTLSEAIAAGSNYAVIGRPITSKADRRKALAEMLPPAK
jgi:orotidine-5'-phosphate decarboxylase